MKRRVIYLSDDEWEDIRLRAQHQGSTMSAYIRGSLVGGHVIPISVQRDMAAKALATQAQRDAILRRINKSGRER